MHERKYCKSLAPKQPTTIIIIIFPNMNLNALFFSVSLFRALDKVERLSLSFTKSAQAVLLFSFSPSKSSFHFLPFFLVLASTYYISSLWSALLLFWCEELHFSAFVVVAAKKLHFFLLLNTWINRKTYKYIYKFKKCNIFFQVFVLVSYLRMSLWSSSLYYFYTTFFFWRIVFYMLLCVSYLDWNQLHIAQLYSIHIANNRLYRPIKSCTLLYRMVEVKTKTESKFLFCSLTLRYTKNIIFCCWCRCYVVLLLSVLRFGNG